VNFIRGDASDDGQVDIADAVTTLQFLFSNGILNCQLSGDTNDDDALDIADAIALLQALFGSGNSIPEPTGSCGVDPTVGTLDCASSLCP